MRDFIGACILTLVIGFGVLGISYLATVMTNRDLTKSLQLLTDNFTVKDPSICSKTNDGIDYATDILTKHGYKRTHTSGHVGGWICADFKKG